MTLELPEQITYREPFGGFKHAAIDWNPLPAMEEYLFNLQAEERSPDYIRMVRTSLARFALWAREQNIRHPLDVDRTTLLMYQSYLNTVKSMDDPEKNLSQSYRQQNLKYLRAWFNWMADVGHIETNPWIRIKIGRQTKQPNPMEPDEIAAMFDAHRQQAFSIDPFYYHRREVILILLYAWGLRIHELRALNTAQMDMRVDWVMAINKGGSTKPMPYGPALKQVINRYLIHRVKRAIPGEDALIIDQNGQRMSLVAIRKVVNNLATRAGVRMNPHRLRDSFGTTMLDYDVEVERIMKMMGHTQRDQTLAYSRVNDHKVKESHDRVMGPIIESLVGTPTGAAIGMCECVIKHPSSDYEIYNLRQSLFDAQVEGDQLAIQVYTAQLTTPCPGLGRSPAGIHDIAV